MSEARVLASPRARTLGHAFKIRLRLVIRGVRSWERRGPNEEIGRAG